MEQTISKWLNISVSNKLCRFITDFQFIRYVFAGGLATVIDWSSFYILAIVFDTYYQIALVISFTLGTLTNYILNKLYTFKCKSKQITQQFSVHASISVISLLISIGLMFLFVDLLGLQKMISRGIITIIMLVINFFMHKHVTYNKRFFQ